MPPQDWLAIEDLFRRVWKCRRGTGLVSESASWSEVWTWEIRNLPVATWSRTKWKSMAMRFIREWNTGLAHKHKRHLHCHNRWLEWVRLELSALEEDSWSNWLQRQWRQWPDIRLRWRIEQLSFAFFNSKRRDRIGSKENNISWSGSSIIRITGPIGICKCEENGARDLSQECQLDIGGGVLQHTNEVWMGNAWTERACWWQRRRQDESKRDIVRTQELDGIILDQPVASHLII